MPQTSSNQQWFGSRAATSRASDGVSTSQPAPTAADTSSAATSGGGAVRSPLPAITLPKGGGTIRGMGEKFDVNPVTGTGALTVPIATSPGRAGFDPELTLSYDSGTGNGPFGFGWSLSLPSITRKTDKGLPKYNDADESDVFILSGAEDLVPVLHPNGSRFEDATTVSDYTIHRYRPRVEGLFARIERWTHQDNGDVHWRSISKDNILTIYGKDENSRIVDPEDNRRIFSWLICETRDDKGNAVIYEYKPEDGTDVDLSQVHERNRGERDDKRRSANRYLKRIVYGNHTPLLDKTGDNVGKRPRFLTKSDIDNAGWMFEVVFDYGEHNENTPTPDDKGLWLCRPDPFSSYRAGFEVRTYRLCQRVLMFHHIPDLSNGEPNGERGYDGLVRSTDFTYRYENQPQDPQNPIYSFLQSVTQIGYKRQGSGYLSRSLPPLEFTYTPVPAQAEFDDLPLETLDAKDLENLPVGLGNGYQWVDLDGEGISGVLTEQADAWFYKPNRGNGRLGRLETVAHKPSLAALNQGRQQLLDLAGDGQLDLAEFAGPTPGFYERTHDERWETFRTFASLPVIDWADPNLRFVDLTGDGHADILITEERAFTWHLSLAEAGFDQAQRVQQAFDEEQGPHLVFADGTQSIFLADMSGDGLVDLARIRNGEVCYWPNLGYGRFGAKVTMDGAPWFDHDDQFDPQRIRLADIDGSGTTDILYLGGDGVRIYFNQSGNSWSEPVALPQFPAVDNLASIQVLDLLGKGTACLVWSSPLPSNGRQPMHYIDLMAGQKPHLLTTVKNNLGAETHIHYVSSTEFYLEDKEKGTPWVTKLPFPVHVVARVETYDHISRNLFVTRYAYHHGYFDGIEREFRGFGMVEQWDTEEYAAFEATSKEADTQQETLTNWNEASHVLPVLTKTWFHTGVYLGRSHISNFFAGLLDAKDIGEYYREPGLTDTQAQALLLDDTVLPDGLTAGEEREACRALKGAMLRQEIYALDGTGIEEYPCGHPYSVTEQNFTIERLQPKTDNRHAVFFIHAREAVSYHYERTPEDPRVSHTVTLDVDGYGNVLKSAAIAYGRRKDSTDVELSAEDREKQRLIHITCTENTFTRPFTLNDSSAQAGSKAIDEPDAYRTPLPAESRTYELRRAQQDQSSQGTTSLFQFNDVLAKVMQAGDGKHDINYEDLDFAKAKKIVTNNPGQSEKYFRRLIEHVRTLYRPNDLGAAQNDPLRLLPLGMVESLALPGESYQLAFTPGLLAQVYGGRTTDAMLETEGRYVHKGDVNWWIPSGRVFYSASNGDSAAKELTEARKHFFLPRRYRDPFHTDTLSTEAIIAYDDHDLLVTRTTDALDNRVQARNDYRVLQPKLVTDPNGNHTKVAFDALGLVVGTAVMGKEGENLGDSLDDFETDLTQAQLDGFYGAADPHGPAPGLLKQATTRIIYDLDHYKQKGEPVYAATLARETHANDPVPPQGLKIQISFSYSDGFGREIQQKVQAEPGPVPKRDGNGKIGIGPDGQPVMTPNNVSPRWVGSAWTVFNNKGKPIRQYEPFFTDTHRFELDVKIGVSPILFYDPLERVVATLHPNHTYEKVVFNPWQQVTWDVNDTVTQVPSEDDAVKGFFLKSDGSQRLSESEYSPTWHQLRTDPAHAADFSTRYPNATDRKNETTAAAKTAAHANTPMVAYFDALGRPFLTVADNGLDDNGNPQKYATRVLFDIEGNQRQVIDAIGRIIMRYSYSMAGPGEDEEDAATNRIHQASMEAGERWMLNDVAGKVLYAWDSRNHQFRTAYDPLRRPTDSFLRQGGSAEMVVRRSIYGERRSNPEASNLRGKLVQLFDQAGAVTSDDYDFKGNLLSSERKLLDTVQKNGQPEPAYKTTVDWNGNYTLKPESYISRTRYDALNRPTQLVAPHSDQPGNKINVIQPAYNDANLLEKVDAWLGRNTEPGDLLDPATASLHAVTDIDYDAKGQRILIDYGTSDGKVIRTRYTYDPKTFRLTHLYTRRGVDSATGQGVSFTDDCDNPQSPPPTIAAPDEALQGKSCGLQNLHYTYDPAGNITHIRDDAQQTIYFHNTCVEPSVDYTYDAIFRLIEATGREHLGQVGGPPVPHSYNDAPRVGLLHPGDGNAMGTYLERYLYDAVGNFLEMQHRGSSPPNPGWTRTYSYNEPSLLEPGKQSNRLSSTTVGGVTANYSTAGDGYDPHGNMLRMPQLQVLQWNFNDHLQMTQRQAVNPADADGVQREGERTWYVYDASGQRIRKVTEKNGQIKDERLYLGGFEIYRKPADNLVRETLHIMDDKQRIALVETRTQGNEPDVPQQLIRYQFGNLLGSASLELDDQAQIISYEEHTPYGSTSYQAVRGQTETPKRYRYTGKERDEESGLYYNQARYFSPWIGSWISCDRKFTLPLSDFTEKMQSMDSNEFSDGSEISGEINNDVTNLYLFNKNNPITYYDPDGHDPVNKAALTLAKALRKRLTREVGKKLAHRGSSTIGKKALNELLKDAQEKALRHVMEHAGEVGGKVVHTQFKKGLSKEKVVELVKATLQKGNKAVLSIMPERNKLAWVIEKEFGEDIGEKAGQRIMRVVVDKEGKLVTAFAVEKVLRRVTIKGIQVSAQLASVAAVFYAAEAKAAEKDIIARRKIAYQKNWVETALEWIVPFGLAESSKIGLEPNFRAMRKSMATTISNVESSLNRSLSEDEKKTIRENIQQIWFGALSVKSDD